MSRVVRKFRGTKNLYGWEGLHRDLIGSLDKVHANTVLQVKTIRDKDGSWSKWLVVKKTGKKLMLVTALIKGGVWWFYCKTCDERRRPKIPEDKYERMSKIFYCRKCDTKLKRI